MINLTVEKLIPRGDGLARLNGKVIFLPQVAPGDRVEAEIIEEKKGFSRARVERILEPSTMRQQPFCPYFGLCGGCNFQHISYNHQLEQKKLILEEIFRRTASLEIPEPEVFHRKDLAYRNRVQIHRTATGQGGFKKRGSSEIIPIDYCPLLAAPLNSLLKSPQLLLDQQRTQVFADNSRYWVDPEAEIQLELLGKEIFFNNRCFFQSNLEMLKDFIPYIIQGQEGNLFLDLFGGVGLFSLFLKDHFKKGIIVESNASVAPWIKKNLGNEIKAIIKPFEKWNSRAMDRPDFAVIDPPRTGIDSKALSRLISLKIPHLCYASCDPVTQARDSALLIKGGYSIKKAGLFDFYPHNSHMETVMHFTL